MLVEAGDLEAGSETDGAGVRRQLAGQQAQQGGLAGAVRAEDADPVAAEDPGREGQQHAAVGEFLADALGLDHHPAAERRGAGRQLDRARRRDQLLALAPQVVELAQPAHVALATRGDAPVQPVRLRLEPLVQALDLGLLGREHLLAPSLEPP